MNLFPNEITCFVACAFHKLARAQNYELQKKNSFMMKQKHFQRAMMIHYSGEWD